MIKFSCKKCGQKLNVEDKHSGKRVKCPKCGSVGVVPDNSDKIKFQCENCGQSIIVPQIHAGKKGKCPKCKNPVVIPSLKKETSESATHRPSVPPETDEDQYEEETDVSEESAGVDYRLIFIISGVAAVVLVGLIILVTVILPSGSRPDEEPIEVALLPKPGDVVINSIGMKLVYIPAGSFVMGSNDSAAQLARDYTIIKEKFSNEFPQHQVRISESFWMGQTEVTQGQYKSVMNVQPWSGKPLVQEFANNPAVYVSWDEAAAFCRKLSQQEGKTYRLPTEAEWEYACRAGTTTRFSFGDSDSSLGDHAWFYDNTDKVDQDYAHTVGQKKPNPWGLYDMHGNVWERCSDRYDKNYYSKSPSVDPKGPSSGSYRSLRGGSWLNHEFDLRCSYRSNLPFDPDLHIGFRVVCSQIIPLPGSNMEPDRELPRQKVSDTDLRSRPATFETQPTKSIVQELQKEESLPKEPVSLRDKLPAQTKIAFTSGKGRTSDIYIMNADGSEQENLTNNPALNETPCWSPDGTKIAFTSNRDGENNSEIYVMNADGSDPVNLTNNPAKDSYPCWSPDGEKIAFSSLREKKPGIYIMYADGSEQMRLTTEMDFYPCFSPDGAKMAFTSYRGTERKVEIYVMNADGSKQTRLTNNSARDMYPCFSPDGKKIAFTSYRDGGSNSEIYIMNVDGSQQTRITNNPKWDLAPCWSPDGKKIAFSSNRDQTNEIYVMSANGSGIKRLTYLPAADTFPCWSPFLDSQSRLATVASDEVGGLDLKLQLKPKQKHNMRIIEENNTSQKATGQSFDIHQTKTTELEFEVEQVDANNTASIKVTYLKLKEKDASQQGQMEYDSTNPKISTDNPFAPTYSAMIGQGFIMKVSPEGKILALSGIDEMYLKMAEKIADSEDEGIRERLKERAQQSIDRTNQRYGSRTKRVEALKEMIKKNPLFGEWRFKELVTHVVVPFSGKSIMIGDSWQAGVLQLPLIPDEIEGTYTLKEKNQTDLTIDIGSKIDIDNVTVPAMGSLQGQTKITLKGSYEGSLQIEQDSGWMIRKKATFKADGEMKMAVNQQIPQGMTTPMSIESIVTVEPIE